MQLLLASPFGALALGYVYLFLVQKLASAMVWASFFLIEILLLGFGWYEYHQAITPAATPGYHAAKQQGDMILAILLWCGAGILPLIICCIRRSQPRKKKKPCPSLVLCACVRLVVCFRRLVLAARILSAASNFLDVSRATHDRWIHRKQDTLCLSVLCLLYSSGLSVGAGHFAGDLLCGVRFLCLYGLNARVSDIHWYIITHAPTDLHSHATYPSRVCLMWSMIR